MLLPSSERTPQRVWGGPVLGRQLRALLHYILICSKYTSRKILVTIISRNCMTELVPKRGSNVSVRRVFLWEACVWLVSLWVRGQLLAAAEYPFPVQCFFFFLHDKEHRQMSTV